MNKAKKKTSSKSSKKPFFEVGYSYVLQDNRNLPLLGEAPEFALLLGCVSSTHDFIVLDEKGRIRACYLNERIRKKV